MSSTADIPAPPQEVINLTWADLIFAVIFFFVSAWISWKHGKAGMVCWPIFNTAFIARIIADIYQIVTKDEPMLPTAVSTMTNAAVIACVSLAIIGVIYECNTILPTKPKSWSAKIMLGVTHLFNTGGIAIATYGGSLSATGAGGVMNEKFNQIGNLILLFVLFAVCGWMWPTYRKIQRYAGIHPSAPAALKMFWAAVAAMPLWLTRIGVDSAYAFNHDTTLDPVLGTFAIKLVIIFGTYFFASVILLAGGWVGMQRVPLSTSVEVLSGEEERADDVEMFVRPK